MIALLSTLAHGQEPVPEPEPAPAPAPPPVVEPGPAATGPVRPERAPDDYARFELSAELGALNNSDPTWDLFSSGNAMPSYGVKAGYRLSERVAAVGSWNLVRHGAFVTVVGSDTDGDFSDDADSFVAALTGHELTLGAKADLSLGDVDVLLPYVSTQGLVLIADMRFDDEPDDRDNPGQVVASAMTGGFLATAGAEIRWPPQSPVAVAWYLEGGYGWLARASFGEVGTMKPGGFAIRSGLGIRL
jgi:hypothetical protein